MSYIVSGQKDWIEMMYSDPLHLEMLESFGRLVEQKVLPAELGTEVQRARNPFSEITSLLQEKKGEDSAASEESIREIRNKQKIPAAVYSQIVESGLTAMAFAEELDGLGLPYPLFVSFLETLGKASPSIGVRYAISNTVAEGLRFNHKTGELSDYGLGVLKDLVSGEKLAAFCLTEASASGSNIMREMETRAVLTHAGGHYVINGNKFWITNAETADVYALFAKTSDDPVHGISLFLVEKENPGVRTGQIFEKRTVENSSFGEIIFQDVKVPLASLVGKLGHGAQYAVRMLNSGRITIAALATGLAQRAFEEYLEVAV
ncbi:MAG: acyl-CoA dehydrogenase family protein, partial [Nitrospinaceae bacterium]